MCTLSLYVHFKRFTIFPTEHCTYIPSEMRSTLYKKPPLRLDCPCRWGRCGAHNIINMNIKAAARVNVPLATVLCLNLTFIQCCISIENWMRLTISAALCKMAYISAFSRNICSFDIKKVDRAIHLLPPTFACIRRHKRQNEAKTQVLYDLNIVTFIRHGTKRSSKKRNKQK